MGDEEDPVKRRWAEHLGVLGAYAALALIMSYPLALHFGDAIPGVQGDVWSYLWAMGWARISTLDLGVNPFRSDYIFYPLGGATQLLWATALPSFLSIPLQSLLGLVPSFNLMYLAATTLTAYGTYLLAKYALTGSSTARVSPTTSGVRLGAFVAGIAFAFSALRLGYGLAFTNLFHTELIPFYGLFLLKTQFEGRWRNPVIAGVLLGLNAYIDFQIAAFLVMFTMLWFIVGLIQSPRPSTTLKTFPSALPSTEPAPGTVNIPGLPNMRQWGVISKFPPLEVIGVVALIVAAPIISTVTQDLKAEGGNYIGVYPLKYSSARSYDLLSYVVPNARSSLYQLLPTPRLPGVNTALNADGESLLSPDRQAFFGLTVLVLALTGALLRPRAFALWITAALLFAVLSFGPTLHLAGRDLGVPLPYAALHELPIANHIRIPMRYGLMTLLGVALLAAAGVNSLAAHVHPALLLGFSTTLILGEAAVLPYPTLNVSVPHVYETIAAQPGDFTILEIPTFNWRAAAASEVFQVVHRKRILRVYTNRIAPELADYFSLRQTPIVVRSLRILEGAEEGPLSAEARSEDQGAAPAVIRFFKLRYAVLHREWLNADAAAQIDQYLREVLGARIVSNEGTVTGYEFDSPAPAGSNHALDLESNLALMYLGRGWQTEPLADAEGERGRFVTLDASELYFERVECDCPVPQLLLRAYSEKEANVLEFELNGRIVGAVRLKQGWADYALNLPADALQDRLNFLRLVHSTPGENRIAINRIEIR